MEPKGSSPHTQQPSHLSLSWTTAIQSTHLPTDFLRISFNIIIPSTSRSSKWSLSLALAHQNPVCTSLCPTHATCPAHLVIVDLISWILCGEEYRSWIWSLCTFLQSFVSSSLLGPKTFLSTLFSNTSLNVSDRTSHLHKTTGKS